MPNKFKIRQRLSSNAKRRTAMVTVEFQGRVFTRHIKDGIGRHPDEDLPKIYAKLEERIEENKQFQQDKLEAIAALQNFGQQKPKGLEDIMRKAAIEILTGMTVEKAKDLVVKMELERQRLVDELQVMQLSLDAMKKEDPLMVSYI